MRKFAQLGIAILLSLGLGYWMGRSPSNRLADSATSRGVASNPSGRPELPGVKGKLRSGKDWLPFTGTAQELLDRALALPGQRDTTYFLYRALEEIPPDQLPGFAAQLNDIPAFTAHQPIALREVQRLWNAYDPASALAWAQGLAPDKRQVALLNHIRATAEISPEAALRLASTLDTPAERESAKSIIVNQLSESDPAAAFALLKTTSRSIKDGSKDVVLRNWARLDPAAAALAISKMPADVRQYQTNNLFQTWAQADPVTALTAAEKIANPNDRGSARSGALQAWAMRDPLAAAEYFKSLPPSDQAKTECGQLFSQITATDPKTAIAIFSSLQGRQRLDVIPNLVGAWRQKDPDAALHWAQSLTSASEKSAAIGILGRAMWDAEASSILTSANQIDNPTDKRAFLKGCFGANSNIDVAKLTLVCQKLESDEMQAIFKDSNIISYAARRDPESTAKLLAQAGLPPSDSAWSNFAEQYSSQDPVAAYAWAATLPTEFQDRVLGSILPRLAQSDAPGALLKAQQIPNQARQKEAISNVFSQWATSDPTAFEQAVPQMTGDLRTAGIARLLTSKISEDPQAAASYLMTLQQRATPEDAPIVNQGLAQLGSAWGESDPQAASAWIAQLPPGEPQEKFIESLAGTWAQSDSMAASTWIKGLPVGKAKDEAVSSLVMQIRKSDPESAVIWAGQIQNESLRESSYQNAIRSLAQKDPTAAARVIEARRAERK